MMKRTGPAATMRSDVGQCDPVLLARFARMIEDGAGRDEAGAAGNQAGSSSP
jgi:hypothetical protein